MECKLKIQTGSINAVPQYNWFKGRIIRYIGKNQFVVKVDDSIYYCNSDELYVNLDDVLNHAKSRLTDIFLD